MDLPTWNGTQDPLSNGIPVKQSVEQNGGYTAGGVNGAIQHRADDERTVRRELTNGLARDGHENGNLDLALNRLHGLPVEVRQLTQHFRPFHKVVHRAVQRSWNDFSDLLDQLSEINLPPSITALNTSYAKSQINGAMATDQSQENLEKKDRLLKFQQDQRALYIKFLVLHDWYQRSRGIDQVIEISMWMHDQRIHFAQAADFIGIMKRELALWQVPNPDLKTAIEVLSNGRVSTLSDFGYVPAKPLSSKGMLRTLQDINILLCTRLCLHDQVPLPLSKYRVHDGRVTFIVPHEFELDLSVADEDPSSQFYFIDFRFLFSQSSNFLSGRLHDELAKKINDVLRADGLIGCHDFLHDLTLSHKLNSLRRQALDMARKQWSESLKIDLIHRTLVVQYWPNRPVPKSWIEIGVKSGRRKQRNDRPCSTGPYLDLRWLCEKKETRDNWVDFNLSPLSIETMLRRVISHHSSIMLDSLYEKLLEFKLYADGPLLLELSSSDTEPSNCSLLIQLTYSKHITLSIEPISGSLILQPASSLSGRTEFELNRLQNPVEDGVQHISMLRCLAAEQEIAQQATISGWEVLQTFRVSQQELRALFPSNILRYVLIRQASWEPNAMIAITFSMEGDTWWLLYAGQQYPVGTTASLVSQHIDCSVLREENGMNFIPFFSQLREYASGAIAFKVAEQELREKNLHCQLPKLPQLRKDLQFPLMKVQYFFANVKSALRTSVSAETSRYSQTQDNNITSDYPENINPSCIHPTVYLRFCGVNKTTQNVLLLAKGRTTASAKVLESLSPLAGSGFKVKVDAGEFLISFQIPVGKSVTSQLFSSLQNFDRLLSCLTIVKSFNSMKIQSLSLSRIAIEYNQQAELSTTIDFPSSHSSVAIRLLPEDSNTHARICHFVQHLLADLRRPFTANLGGVLTMLTTTFPLLTLFDELEMVRNSSAPAEENPTAIPLILHLHVIARSPTHYALQYFMTSPHSDTMIARFEIFRHLRRHTPVWILRAALEETVAYSRSSFMDIALKQKLTDDVFNARGAPGWLGLDTGASCPIASPGPLVRKVDEVVRSWAKESLKEVSANGQKREQSSKGDNVMITSESTALANPSANPSVHQQHQQLQRPGNGGSRPTANGTSQNRRAINNQKSQSQGPPRLKDVITLD
jgi:mediator of RNA polymerase II transcription subunit 14